MALMTPEQFEASLKKLKPRVFMNGKKVDSILENRNTRTVVEANKASYEWALDPRYRHIMSCYSPLINDQVNRYTYVSASIDDLVKKAEAGTFTAEMLGTCIYRCVGYDAFHSLASTCWEMDRDLGTEYHPRFLEYLKMVQRQDLSVAGALTEPRGKREPEDPGLARSFPLLKSGRAENRRDSGARRQDQHQRGFRQSRNGGFAAIRPCPG